MSEQKSVHSLADYAHLPSGNDDKMPGPIYGIIMDSTCRYFKPHNRKYMATLKIIDRTWNKNECPLGFIGYVKVVFMSMFKKDVPNIKSIGSIIRLQYFALRRINEKRVNSLVFTRDMVSAKCKWEIITNDCIPMDLESIEEKHINTLRVFCNKFLKEQYFVENTINLNSGKDKAEFNALVKLTETKVLLEESKQGIYEMIVIDHTEKARIRIDYQTVADEFPKFDQNSLLLIKAVKYKNEKDDILEMKDYGNVLIVPNGSKVYSRFFDSLNYFIEWIKAEDRIVAESMNKSFMVSQVVDTSLPITILPSVFSTSQQLKHRVFIYIIDIGPKDIKNWVKGYCATCDMSFTLNENCDDTKPICALCNNEGEVIYQLQFFVKDREMREEKDTYKLLLYTHNGKGSEFFDQEPPTNLYKDRRLYTKLRSIYRVLITYGVYLDCTIEKLKNDKNSYYQIVDTVVSCDCVEEITY